jgi:hypothetical protein
MQEFVNKQLSGWIQEGVTSGLSNLLPALSTLTIDQIREVVQAKQPMINSFTKQAQKEKREREYQKEKEFSTRWLQEQCKEAETKMEKRLAEKTEQLRRLNSKPPTIRKEEGKASGTAAARLSRWASLIPPDLPELPPLSKAPSLPPLSLPKSRRHKAQPSLSSSSCSSSSNKGRHHKSWTKGPKGRNGKKYCFKLKAPCVKQRPFRQVATQSWEYSANKSEDLRARIRACEDSF